MDNKKRLKAKEFFEETFSEEFIREAEVEYTLAKIAAKAYSAKQDSGLSFRAIAKRMGLKSPAVVQRIVNDALPHNVTLATLVKFGQACGFDIDINFKTKYSEEIARYSWSKQDSAAKSVLNFSDNNGTQRESRPESTRENYVFSPGGIFPQKYDENCTNWDFLN